MVFLLVAALVWWQARESGYFFIVGLGGTASADLGPLLPALCGGLTAAMALLLADAAAGPVAGVLAAAVIVALPGFSTLHRESLSGPPLLVLVMLMASAMVHAPRFSIAYGMVAAVAGIFVSTDGIGLPVAAAAWALVQPTREKGTWQRVALSLAPSVVLLVLAHYLGGAWPSNVVFRWHGGLDAALRAGGAMIAGQLVPPTLHPPLRTAVLAAAALVVVAVIVSGWRRATSAAGANAVRNAIYPVIGLVAAALISGLAARTGLVENAPEPDLAAMMPLVMLGALALAVSAGASWRVWPRWSRVAAVLVTAAWVAGRFAG